MQVEPDNRQREDAAYEDRHHERNHGNPAVEHDLGAEREPVGAKDRQQPDAEGADREAEQAAGGGQQDGLQHDFARDAAGAGAQCLAHGQLLGAAAGADQQEIHEIDAANQQQEEHGAPAG